MKKDVLDSLFNQSQTVTSQKQVTFSDRDDVMYIHPWSPTKFLLFGKYTENEIRQLRRYKMSRADQPIVPILKKTDYSGCPEESGYALLKEIVIEESLPRHPLLPSMAIFSPSNQKESITNNPISSTLKPLKKKKNTKQLSSSSFTLVGQQLPVNNDPLPQISSKQTNEAYNGCVKNINDLSRSGKFIKMPSICNIDKNARQKPLIKTQISQMYSLDADDLSSVQNLCEEVFSSDVGRSRELLPTIKDTPKINNQNNYSKFIKNKNKRKTQIKNCKQEINLFEIFGDIESITL